jgi:hypothetical protein
MSQKLRLCSGTGCRTVIFCEAHVGMSGSLYLGCLTRSSERLNITRGLPLSRLTFGREGRWNRDWIREFECHCLP